MHTALSTRRGFLTTVGAAAAALVAPRWARADELLHRLGPAPGDTVQRFRSRPDLTPPAIEVTTPARDTAAGYVFVAPLSGPGGHGPLILDDAGKAVWFRPLDKEIACNFRVQTYRGTPALTWWQGTVVDGAGQGECVIADATYRDLRRVGAGNGQQADLHEFLLTDRDTALLTVYATVPFDLTRFGGPADGSVVDGIVQEVDLSTGRVVFEWHSLDHVGIDESKRELPDDPKAAHDYFHVNSVDVDTDGDLIVSARHTWTVYKLDRQSGEVLWRLGGSKSDFVLGPGASFGWQHDARRHPYGTITIFDDASGAEDDPQSRAIELALDEAAMRASLVGSYRRADPLLVDAMGSAQLLPDGGVFVGWGTAPWFSEVAPDGTLRFDATFAGGGESYRAFRFPWVGRPQGRPALALERSAGGAATLRVSWNGATQVYAWKVLLGPHPGRLRHLRSVGRAGFETTLTLHGRSGYVAVAALDADRRTLGTSPVHRL